MAQEAARRMIAAKKEGSIVNLASVLAFRAQKALSTYSISKAAVAQMTRAMAAELAPHGIRVNALAPGYIATAVAMYPGANALTRIPCGASSAAIARVICATAAFEIE